MNAPAASGAQTTNSGPTRRQSFLLVFSCTLIGALAQMFIKSGAGAMKVHLSLPDVLHHPMLIFSFGLEIVKVPVLFLGYALYGVNTFLMAYALKGRELSRLWPIIALTYVWVTALSVIFLREHLDTYRALGLTLIIAGVSILGGKAAEHEEAKGAAA